MSERKAFAAMLGRELPRWIKTVGDALREPPDPLPVPDKYTIGLRTTWQGWTARVQVSINGVEVTERFRFGKPRGVDYMHDRFESIVKRLWLRVLEKTE